MVGDKTLPGPVRRAVEDAVTARFGGRVLIECEQNFGASWVFRCALGPARGDGPETVIVRLPRVDTARAGRGGLDRERAALEFLAAAGRALAPRFLAGGGAAGFVVTEDLGTHPSLLDLFLGNDGEAARRGFVAFAEGLGRLHAQTAGGNAAGRPIGLPIVTEPVEEHWRQVRRAVAELGQPAPDGVERDVEELARLLAKPGDWRALSSGDPSVVNCQIYGGRARFFDFEAACFRHALVDAAVLRFPYPTGGPPWRLPPDIALAGEAAYRAEGARDDGFERGLAAASLAWTLRRLVRLPRVDAGPDRDAWPLVPPGWTGPVPTRSRRRQLVAIVETGHGSARRADAFPALADWCERLADVLRARWPEASEMLPLYPAFLEGLPS